MNSEILINGSSADASGTEGQLACASLKGDEFRVERYKFILSQLSWLNQSVHRYLTHFQTLQIPANKGKICTEIIRIIDKREGIIKLNGPLERGPFYLKKG